MKYERKAKALPLEVRKEWSKKETELLDKGLRANPGYAGANLAVKVTFVAICLSMGLLVGVTSYYSSFWIGIPIVAPIVAITIFAEIYLRNYIRDRFMLMYLEHWLDQRGIEH